MKTENATRLKCAWQYLRELRFIDPEDRIALRDWYHAYHRYIWCGFFVVSAIDLLAAPRGTARIASAVLTLTAGLLWAFA
jgi:hypothetical protein